MTIILYLLKTILVSAILLAYYGLFLRNKSCHRFNRGFLLGIPVFSLLVPLLRFVPPHFWGQDTANTPVRLLGVMNGTLEEAVTVYARHGLWHAFPWETLCLATGLLVSLFFFLRFYRALRQIYFLRRNHPFILLENTRIYRVDLPGTPFSFFHNIFWNEAQPLDTVAGQQILRHELYHVHHNHSRDILYLEICRICCWFNPVIHLVLREVQATHEFTADADAAAGGNRLDYAELLLINSFRAKSHALTHPFFQNQIKRRIAMITTTKKFKTGLPGRILILPVAALLLGLFAFNPKSGPGLLSPVAKTIRVVVDAGHGGQFGGITVNGLREQDLNLAIADKIRRLAKDYQVEVIMTRADAETAGHASNLRDDLLYRAKLAGREHADLFVSIHGGDASATTNGFEIYVPKAVSPVYSGSVKLGSNISESIGRDHPIAAALKQRDRGILVLDQATVPAVLIVFGNLEEKSDFDFITDAGNQEKIARDILEGIRKYAGAATVYQDAQDPVDTLTLEQMKKLDPATINAMHVERTLITLDFKNGKKAVVKVTDDMRGIGNSADTSGKIFTKVEFEAQYPGGGGSWTQYLSRSLHYPAEAAKRKIEGVVLIQFVVEKDGTLKDITALSGPEELKEESIRVIRESGKWKPAKQAGQIVRSFHRQPIVYKMNG